ncbi:MAG: DUF3623 domain-containing protein [Proteobacteria bacterium]|nr:DUF3623 domain-containing protein [Burkholderiales bacterium]
MPPMSAEVADLAWPALYALLVWWFTTGLIVYLDGLARSTYRWSMLGATVLGVSALFALARTNADTSVASAYCAFTCAVLVWGWIEVSFLMGYVTGPLRQAAPPEATEWQRFRLATGAILHHELFILLTGVVVIALTWEAPNQTGTWTFLVLWAMRLSAKLNLFFGVRNRGEEFLPEKMRYLDSFFARRSINLLFPVVVTASTALVSILWWQAVLPGAGAFDVAALSLVAALLSLAILEHWFMVLPLPSSALWRWAMRDRRDGPAAAAAPPPGTSLSAIDLPSLPLKAAD